MSINSKTTRITLDLPSKLHIQVKTKASQKGKTLKKFFIELAEENLQISDNSKKTKRQMPKGLDVNLTNDKINQIISEVWVPKF